jgi:hypothetical protein
MIDALAVTGHFSRSFGMFERQALLEDIEQKVISLGKEVSLPFARDNRVKGMSAFACLSAAELGFSEKATQPEIFAAIMERSGTPLERDDEFIFVSSDYRHFFSGCCVLYTEPFLHHGMLALPAFHCGQRILVEPISASDDSSWSINTRFVFGL